MAWADPPRTLLLPPPPPRRRRSPAAVLLVVLAVLALVAAGMVVGDYAVRHQVENQAAGRLQAILGTPDRPTVDVGGFPFAPQALGSDISRVHVLADDVGETSHQGLEIRHLDVTLDHVTSDDRFQTAEARSVTGLAQVDIAALAALTGKDLSYAGGGRVAFTTSTPVLDQTLNVVVSGIPVLDVTAQSLTLTDAKVQVANVQLPQAVVELLQRTLVKPLPITGVPLGLQVVGLSVDDSGVDVRLQGADVRLAAT